MRAKFVNEESYINKEGKLVISKELKDEIKQELENEKNITLFNKHLKEFLNKKYVFNTVKRLYTWQSNSENTYEDFFDKKEFRLKKIIPEKGLKNIYFELIFNPPLKHFILTANSPLEITNFSKISYPLRQSYAVYYDSEFFKNNKGQTQNYFMEFAPGNYETFESLKMLQDLLKELINNVKP